MISLYGLKPRFVEILGPVCRGLAGAGVTANQVTIAAVALSVATGAWIASEPVSALPYLALPVVLLIRLALNAIDGMLAREFHMRSPLGGILNEIGDVVSDAALYLPFGFHPSIEWRAIVCVVLLSLMVEMIGVVAVQIGATRRHDGPFGKSDRALAFGLLALSIGLGLSAQQWVSWYLAGAIVLSAATLVNRARKAIWEAGDDA